MTSLAISIVPFVGEAVTPTLALGEIATSDGDTLGSVDGDSEPVVSTGDGSELAGRAGGCVGGGPGPTAEGSVDGEPPGAAGGRGAAFWARRQDSPRTLRVRSPRAPS